MAIKQKAGLGVFLLCFGFIFLMAPMGCQPSAPPPKSQKDTKSPLSPEALEHFRQGHKFLAGQKMDEALKEFQETVRLNPDSPLAHFWVGKIYFYRGDKEQAEKEMKQTLQLDPKNYHAMAMLGKIYSLDRAKVDQAKTYLDQALVESPDNLEAHFDLGRVYAIKGERERAMAEFRYLFSKEGEFSLYHYEMGRILEAWGDPNQALNHYRRALLFNPKLEPVNQAIKRLESAAKQAPPSAGGAGAPKTPPAKP
jgi:tetratricopeptide (TPR) repeat protein